MKFSTILAVLAVSLAFATTGCKYDKAKKGGAGMGDGSAQVTDISTGDEISSSAQGGSLAGATEGRFEDMYARCTDVAVEGHCDERGSNEYNMSLGENRAIILRNYLVQSGIAPERIQTRSFGEEKPAVEGHDESAWGQNRRGEFDIFQK
jgi:peptidoglycan-associated lipoprotein